MDPIVINQNDYRKYIEREPNKIEHIWANIVAYLPSEQLKKEARYKGFALFPHPKIKEDIISRTFVLTVPNGSRLLKEEFEKVGNVVSMIKD